MDATGRCYVYQKKDELTKNHREDCKAQEGGLMYELSGGPALLSMEKYISKLNPRNAAFFHRPKEHTTPEDPIWYCNEVVGINTLGSKMKTFPQMCDCQECIPTTPFEPHLLSSWTILAFRHVT